MSRTFLISTLFAGGIALCVTQARAGTGPCAPRPEVLESLSRDHNESRRSIALADSGVVVETFAAEGGTWTIVVTRPDGVSCLLASGRYFEAVDEPIPSGEPG